MIRRTLRLGVRLGLLGGMAMALFKLVKGRRASDFGSPSPDWAPAPAPNANLPRAVPEPELVKPVILEEIVEKRKAPVPSPEPQPDPPLPDLPIVAAPGESVVKKAAPAKKAAPVRKAAEKVAADVPPPPPPPAPAGGPATKASTAKPGSPADEDLPPAALDARRLAASKKAGPAKKSPPKKS